jgi:hypothetical protein
MARLKGKKGAVSKKRITKHRNYSKVILFCWDPTEEKQPYSIGDISDILGFKNYILQHLLKSGIKLTLPYKKISHRLHFDESEEMDYSIVKKVQTGIADTKLDHICTLYNSEHAALVAENLKLGIRNPHRSAYLTLLRTYNTGSIILGFDMKKLNTPWMRCNKTFNKMPGELTDSASDEEGQALIDDELRRISLGDYAVNNETEAFSRKQSELRNGTNIPLTETSRQKRPIHTKAGKVQKKSEISKKQFKRLALNDHQAKLALDKARDAKITKAKDSALPVTEPEPEPVLPDIEIDAAGQMPSGIEALLYQVI